MSLSRCVELRIIPARLNVIDITHPHEPHAAMVLHRESNQVSRSLVCGRAAAIVQQLDQPALAGMVASIRKCCPCTLKCCPEAISGERLQQVVEGVGLERLQCIAIVGSDE